MNRHFTFIDLFAGIGGFRIAFGDYGGECVMASEWDKYAQMTYEANFGHKPEGDITKIAAESIPDHDILTAGFPCQPFSIAGVTKHNALGNQHGFLNATQGTLFFDVARIIKEKRPKAFLLENVKNLVSHDGGKTFQIIQQTLEKELGYHIYPQILDARKVVPQHRERIYIVGFREPVADFKPLELPDKDDPPRFRDILEGEVDDKYTLSDHLWTYLQNYAAKHKSKGNGFGYGLTDLDGVSRTLSARYYKDGAEILIPQEHKNPRRLTPRECARLMGYDDTYKIVCSDTRAYKQFGNSVVVPVVRYVAGRIVQALDNKVENTCKKAEQMYQLQL
ncbi:MAG TPA: DNA (cytosine-5-)-methyltransferase [Ktedonobacteraceae bacterium]|nr:DNA (cytosine-5-)-methyltransferase [Ktedonobacteraceae bacterium]